MRRQNPYNLERGEFPVSVTTTETGTFLLTTKRVYRFYNRFERGAFLSNCGFEAIKIDRPPLREIK